MNEITNVKGLLVDLEGVLYSDNNLIPGSLEVIKELKKNSLKLRFLTNTTTAPRKLIFNKLQDFGFHIEEEEIFTPIIATKNYLRDNRVKRIALITNIEIIEPNKEQQDSYSFINVRAGISNDMGLIEFYIDNITDERGEISNNYVFDRARVTYIRPTTLGLRFKRNFN